MKAFLVILIFFLSIGVTYAEESTPRYSLQTAKEFMAKFGKNIQKKIAENGISEQDIKRIKRVRANTYEIPEDLRLKALMSIPAFSKTVSIQERAIDDRGLTAATKGYAVVRMSASSIFRSLGFLQEDLVYSINDSFIDSTQAAVNIFNKEKFSRNVTVRLLRAGKDVTLRYVFI